MSEDSKKKPRITPPSGGFIVGSAREGIFCREKLSEDQLLMMQAVKDFFREQVMPRIGAIERREKVLEGGTEMPIGVALLKSCAELGIAGYNIPEEYGGLGMNRTSAMTIAESTAGCASFVAMLGVHTGIGTLPIVYFGTKEQKQRYLPAIANADLVTCYALTEAGSGSDALSLKTSATPIEDGAAYLLNGSKQFITSGGWADIAIVFAQIAGQVSAFVVDLHAQGVSRGPEEKKLGLHGASTTALNFQDVRVPAADLLGKPGDGPSVALNTLYMGRMTLGFFTLGNAKHVIDLTVKFGKERKQFGQPVITFAMQKGKLAEMVASTYAVDSALYRVIGDIDASLAALDRASDEYAHKVVSQVRAYGVEASIVKVAATENLTMVAHHAVRMHGGYGFCEEYQVERFLRDNVVDTIFEGTNDVNRLLIFGNTVESIFGAAIGFREWMERLHADLRAGRVIASLKEGALAEQWRWVVQAKRALTFTLERAIIGLGKDLRVEQQVAAAMADAMMALFAAESTVARVGECFAATTPERRQVLEAVTEIVLHNAFAELRRLTLAVLGHVARGPELGLHRRTLLELLAPLERDSDVMRARTLVADHIIERGHYDL